MVDSKTKAAAVDPAVLAKLEDEVTYLAKRHRISAAIIREIIRSTGVTERSAIEREIQKGKARR